VSALLNAERYRGQAAQLRVKARMEKSRPVRDELEALAQCYVALAERHERMSRSEGVTGSPAAAPG
jgi:hypothetical protein